MFCPKCSAYLTEKDVLKTDVKYAPGNVPIEYIATCPNCRVEMGRISWGQLTVFPELEAELKRAKARESAQQEQAASPEQTAVAKTCPHCGRPLPEGF